MASEKVLIRMLSRLTFGSLALSLEIIYWI
jgi:hypothetical protein